MLDHLPEELLIMIIKKLDTKSLKNLYETGNSRIQNTLSVGVVKEADLAFGTIATGRTLSSNFVKAVSPSIRVLNLMGIADLTKTILLPAMKRLRSLTTLDVSYTNVTIFELLDICEVCPTIENVAVDFQFNKLSKLEEIDNVSQEMVDKCQNTFGNLKNVHFIGSQENLYRESLAYILLQKAKLHCLTFTIARFNHSIVYPKHIQFQPLCCDVFCINKAELRTDIFSRISFDYEYVKFSTTFIEASPQITPFLLQYLRLPPPLFCDLDYNFFGMMIWNKETTVFDEKFFMKLLDKIKKLPRLVTVSNLSNNTIETLSLQSDWYYLTDEIFKPMYNNFCRRAEICENSFKRVRKAPPTYEINFDEMNLFMDKRNVKLNLTFQYSAMSSPISFAIESHFMNILSYLSLRGTIHYSKDFFSILFRNCKQLVTLSVDGPSISPCALNISRTISLSSSLKNLRLKEKNIDFDVLLSSLGQCKTLENIVLNDPSQIINELAKPDTLIAQCDNLYYISICAQMSDSSRLKHYRAFNKAKLRFGKYHLHCEILSRFISNTNYIYNPYYHVYNNKCQYMAISNR